MKKLAALILCAALVLTALAGFSPVARATVDPGTDTGSQTEQDDPEKDKEDSYSGDAIFYIGEKSGYLQGVPQIKQGATWKGGNLLIKYTGDVVSVDAVEMVANSTLSEHAFPFQKSKASYVQIITADTAVTDGFVYKIDAMRVREDAEQQYYDISFNITYTSSKGSGQTASVKYTVIVLENSSSTSSSDNSVPKVIITGNTTNPTSVVAGEPFVLGITLKNTSSSETITNLVASMDAGGTFKPVSGSSSLYIASLAPGESKSVSLRLTSKADTSPDSYTASFAITYDAANSKDGSASSNETIAIPVTQVPKVSATKLQLQPTDIYVNQDLNVMSTINNTGKSKIYNLTVTISDSAGLFDESETYLGNIEAGSTGNVDVYVAPTATGSTTLRMVGEYEDENGTKYTVEQASDIEVMEQQSYEPIIDDMTDDTEQSGGKWWLWLILVLAVAGLAAAIVLRARAKKKAAERDRQAVEELNRKFIDEDRNAENK